MARSQQRAAAARLGPASRGKSCCKNAQQRSRWAKALLNSFQQKPRKGLARGLRPNLSLTSTSGCGAHLTSGEGPGPTKDAHGSIERRQSAGETSTRRTRLRHVLDRGCGTAIGRCSANDALIRCLRGFVDTRRGSCILKTAFVSCGIASSARRIAAANASSAVGKGTPGRGVGLTDRARP